MVGYQVADANEYLVVTGLGIDDFELKKKRMVWPLQRYESHNDHYEEIRLQRFLQGYT
jgi:hypothetical protein